MTPFKIRLFWVRHLRWSQQMYLVNASKVLTGFSQTKEIMWLNPAALIVHRAKFSNGSQTS